MFARRSSSLRLTLLVAMVFSSSNALAAQPLNVVLILADDFGWSDLGCYGSQFMRTPNVDQLAAVGMRFTNAYAACHVCSPTRAAIMTGRYPARLHLTDYIPGGRNRGLASPDWRKYLPLKETTIAERLAERGYVCGHFGKWHLNKDKHYEPGRPMDPGSQGFHAVLATRKPSRDTDPASDPHHVDEITSAAIAFLEENRDRPFFCYVPHNSVHRPIIAEESQMARLERRLPEGSPIHPGYIAMVEHLDHSVGRIVAALEELDLADNTLLIYASDNGGFLGDEQERGTTNEPLRGGKGTNYEGGVRVPLIVRGPMVPPGTTCHTPVISNDLFATIDELTGGSIESLTNPIDAESLAPLLRDPQAELERDALYWHYPHYHALGATPHGAIRAGKWKLIEFYEDMHIELYDLDHDLGEQHDLADAMPKVADRLRDQLHQWRQSVGAQMPIDR